MFLWLSLFLISGIFASTEVDISQGKLRGRIIKSRNGRDFFGFNRIPYATPPVGKFRFKPSLPAGPWNGTLDATESSPLCFQLTNEKLLVGEEDCLYLNVYTPKIINASLPVMIYIHGGGFIFGQTPPADSSKYFMDEDVVLVTMSYRLNALGFLSFEDDLIAGNMGLKDQALAVEWVIREIGNFGGNPNLITIFGNSAGSVSAHYLCSSTRLGGLVKGCISQSGAGGTKTWAIQKPGEAKIAANNLAVALGCFNENVLSCLQSKSVEEIFNLKLSLLSRYPKSVPVIERASEQAVITAWPSQNNNFPWLTGITEDEGMLLTANFEFIERNYSHDKYMKFFETVIMEKFNLTNKTKDVRKVLNRFLEKESDHILAGRKFGTEAFFLYPTLKALNEHQGPKYFYVFKYIGGPSYYEVFFNKDLNITGICHNDDYPYFFSMPNKFIPDGWPSPDDIKLSQTLIKAWVSFATEQSPSIGIPQWKSFDDRDYLSIENNGLKSKKLEDMDDVINFWKDYI